MHSAFLILLSTSATVAQSKLETVFEWRYIDYLWDSPAQKQQFIQNGDYNYTNIVPIDVDRARDGRIFVTAIRNTGVPASLAVVTDQLGPSGPLLKPYPGWSWYRRGDCNAITSVYRVVMDECNKMYVLDTGYIGDNYTCPAQVLIFDLTTDRLVDRIKIPDRVSQNRNGTGKLVTPAIEVNGTDCELQNLFMADVNGRGLVVYNKDRLFRLEAHAFEPEQPYARVSIAGQTFELGDSLMGLAVTPSLFENEGRDLIFRPFASRAVYTADTRVLARSIFGDAIKYKSNHDMLPSQATAMGISSQGTLFFGLTQEIAIGCWNRYRSMSRDNVHIAAQDANRLQFLSGLKVIPRSRANGREEVWTLSNRLQTIMAGTTNYNETNFRVIRASVDDLVSGTRCESPMPNNQQFSPIRKKIKSIFLILLCAGVALASSKLETVFEWQYIDYLLDSPAQKQQYIQNGDYNHTKIVPIDVDLAEDGRIFITAIRNTGVPASVAVVTDQYGPSGLLLKPYPDWSWFKKGDCSGITSARLPSCHECNKMYVLDNGVIGSQYFCPAQVLVFHLKTDELVNRIRISNHVSQNKEGKGKLVTPALEVDVPNCELRNIFMSDVTGRGLVIYNRHRVFRLDSHAFKPEPEHINATIAGYTFELEDGLMGLAVSPKIFKGEKSDLIFRPFSSRALYSADTQVLSRSSYGGTIKYKHSPNMLPSQATVMGFSLQGTLFYGLTNEVAIWCWNRYKDMTKENTDIAEHDHYRLQFMSGLKVIPASRTHGEEEVWLLSNGMQKIMTSNIDYNEPNFRVTRASVQDLVRGTKCKPPMKMTFESSY